MHRAHFGSSLVTSAFSITVIIAVMGAEPPRVEAQSTSQVAPTRSAQDDIEALRREYDRRLREMEETHRRELDELEDRLDALGEPKNGTAAERQQLTADIDAFLDEAEAEAAADNPSSTTRLNAFNPRITVFGDFVGRLDSRAVGEDPFTDLEPGEENIGDRFSMREVELDLRADIDPYVKGVLILAFAEEAPEEFEVELEEGYAVFTSLPFNLQPKIGKFRTAFGVNNQLHTHDLPQTTRPLPIRAYLGPEGDSEPGVSLSWLVPGAPVELIAQVVNGENDVLFAGAGSGDLAYVGRASWFQDLDDDNSISLGASDYFGYNDEDGSDHTNLLGVDTTYTWKPRDRTNYRSLVFSTEGFWQDREVSGGEDQSSLGVYAFIQYQPDKDWYFGTRWDWVENPFDDTDQAWSGSAYVSYYTTEFLRLRLGFEHMEADGADDLDTLFFEMTFAFGSHPPHPYWVNR